MERRPLGNRDAQLPIIGFPGISLRLDGPEKQSDINALIAEAVAAGSTYFDVAPTYGEAQARLGLALEPHRDECFLACKTTERSSEGAKRELHESLETLRTDHFDLYQLHAISKKDADQALSRGGAIDTLLDAKAGGLTRFIGLTAHDEEGALQCIETDAFDSVMIAVNFQSFETGNYARRVLEAARQRGMGVIAIKALARRPVPDGKTPPYPNCWYEPEDDSVWAERLWRYALSLQGVTAAIAPGDVRLYRMALRFTKSLRPIDDADLAALRDHYADVTPVFPIA